MRHQPGFPEITFAIAANADTLYNEDGKPETTQKLFYHSDHLGTNSFITDSRCQPFQFFLNLPFGEVMAEQYATEEYQNPYKFNGKELDAETGLYYYGARYYDPRISVWLSVDPLAEKYAGISPYTFCVDNPVRLVDPNGMDWFETTNEDGSKSVKWNKSTSQNFTDESGKWSNIGKTYSTPMSDGSYVNSFQNIEISVGEKSNALSTIAKSSGLTNLFLSSPYIDDNDKSSVFNASINQAKNDFIRGSAELSCYILNSFGDGMTYAGTAAMVIPGGQGVGGVLISAGSVVSAGGTLIDMGLNIADGDKAKLINNSLNLGLSFGLSKGIGKLRMTEGEADFLEGASGSQLSIIKGMINWGLDRKKGGKE